MRDALATTLVTLLALAAIPMWRTRVLRRRLLADFDERLRRDLSHVTFYAGSSRSSSRHRDG